MRPAVTALLGVLAIAASACAGGGHSTPDTATQAAPSQPASAPSPPTTAAPSRSPHLVVVYMENHGFSDIVGNPCCPFETRLAHEGTLFTQFYGVAYPSKPNYLAFGGGATFGQVGSDDPLPPIAGRSLFAQLSAGGVTWAAWAEDYPGGSGHCSLVPTAPGYAMRHVAPLLFADVADTALCSHVTATEPRRLPQFLWVTPSMCDDDHDCPPASGDRWLAGHVPAWIRQGAEVFITYDTGNPDTTHGGGRVFAVLAGRRVPRRTDATTMSHYSALAGVERAFRLPLLGAARSAAPVRF